MPHEQNIIDLVCSLCQSQEQKVDMISIRGNVLVADLFKGAVSHALRMLNSLKSVQHLVPRVRVALST